MTFRNWFPPSSLRQVLAAASTGSVIIRWVRGAGWLDVGFGYGIDMPNGGGVELRLRVQQRQ